MYNVTCFLYIWYVIKPPRSNIPCEDMLDIPMTVETHGDGANSLSDRGKFQSPELAGLLREQKHTAKTHNKQIGQPYWTESASEQPPRTSPGRAGSVRRTGACVRTSIACRHVVMCLGAWSSGRIRASGARGRGFDSRSSPIAHRTSCASSRGTRAPNAGQ